MAITLAQIRRVNRGYRGDERAQAHLWPVNRMGFDFAERVIAVAGEYRLHAEVDSPSAYKTLLHEIAGIIVNDSAYWDIGLRATIRRFFGEVSA